MAREKLSAEAIQKIVQQQIDAVPRIGDDKADIKAPLPYWIESGPDACNWDMSVFVNANGYEVTITGIVKWARSQFKLI
jgi:hypothetical protein